MSINLSHDRTPIIQRIRHLFNQSNEPKSYTQIAQALKANPETVECAVQYHMSEFHVDDFRPIRVRLLDERDPGNYNEFVNRFERPVRFE
jgi:hypothetical protein